uniref:Uncharacterized protein n=1 Tax=Avena sativa TaxID=4498 RepID=A0ACD5TSW8_AVESA
MATADQKKDIEFLWKWRKYLLLLATLGASATYVAGLNPPGGMRSQDGAPVVYLHRVAVDPPLPPAVYPNRIGDPVLASTYSRQYNAFFYCNAMAFVASLVVIIRELPRRRGVHLLSVLFGPVFAYVAVHVSLAKFQKRPAAEEESHKIKERRKFLLLLATFATPLTYGAGLAPPGGFWSVTEAGHRAGAPLLRDGRYKILYHAFFYANATSFVASLAIIMLLLSRSLSGHLARSYALLVCVLVELLGLMAAFAAGSCRWITTTAYIFSLIALVLVYIVFQVVILVFAVDMFDFDFNGCRAAPSAAYSCAPICRREKTSKECKKATAPDTPLESGRDNDIAIIPPPSSGNNHKQKANVMMLGKNGQAVVDNIEQSRSLLLLLATLAATVTYQAGLSPPDMPPRRYKAFYYCNTSAFVASVVVIVIIQSKHLSSGAAVRRAALNTGSWRLSSSFSSLVNQKLYKQSIRSSALHVCMLVGLLGLMGAYAAGSCRKLRTSIYVFALVATVVTFLVLQILLYMSAGHSSKAGLAPPGGTWGDDEDDTSPSVVASNPILLDSNGPRYRAFFYCNVTSCVASVVVIMLLLQRTVKKKRPTMQPIEKKRPDALMWAMQTVVVLDLLGLLGAYAAGSCRDWETSAYVMALIAVVVLFITLHVLMSFDTVLNKSKKLKVWQYFQGGNDNQASRNGVNA